MEDELSDVQKDARMVSSRNDALVSEKDGLKRQVENKAREIEELKRLLRVSGCGSSKNLSFPLSLLYHRTLLRAGPGTMEGRHGGKGPCDGRRNHDKGKAFEGYIEKLAVAAVYNAKPSPHCHVAERRFTKSQRCFEG